MKLYKPRLSLINTRPNLVDLNFLNIKKKKINNSIKYYRGMSNIDFYSIIIIFCFISYIILNFKPKNTLIKKENQSVTKVKLKNIKNLNYLYFNN